LCAVQYREVVSHSPASGPTHEELLAIFAQPKTIAVVGASTAVGVPAHDIPRYLQSQGYRIVPVNPRGNEILGVRAFPSLAEVDVPIDVVDVFRPSREAAAVAHQAVAVGAKVLWFQPGTDTDEAAAIATEAGLTVIRRRCMGVTHGLLGLGPGPHQAA
jgi:predicted CoA-binding protein